MKGLANGIDKSKKLVVDAVDGVAADMIINPKVAAPEMAMAGGSSVGSSDLSSLVGAHQGCGERNAFRQNRRYRDPCLSWRNDA